MRDQWRVDDGKWPRLSLVPQRNFNLSEGKHTIEARGRPQQRHQKRRVKTTVTTDAKAETLSKREVLDALAIDEGECHFGGCPDDTVPMLFVALLALGWRGRPE